MYSIGSYYTRSILGMSMIYFVIVLGAIWCGIVVIMKQIISDGRPSINKKKEVAMGTEIVENSKELQLQTRLKFIDFLLFFRGWFTRQDLTEEFMIASTGATRNIASYKEKEKENALKLNEKTKRYEVASNFEPIFSFGFNRAVLMLKKQAKKGKLGAGAPVPFEYTEKLTNPSISVLAAISRSIGAKAVANVNYYSMTSKGERKISPHAFFEVGEKVYVRAYCHRNSEFRNFSLGRITQVTVMQESQPKEADHFNDDQWHRKVKLEIVPHESLSEGERGTLGLEFGLTNERGAIEVKVRAAICGFWLDYWKVDCSAERTMGDKWQYPLMLANPEALYDVESAKLAPGIYGKNKT